MSRSKPYKHHKKGTGRFVQLPEWMMATEAWKSLKPGPRALYVELKRRYFGNNNGRIRLSHREAAAALGVGRNTVGGYFETLQDRGFIKLTGLPYLGPSGIGLASEWALEEYQTEDLKPATKSFTRWTEKQNPRSKTGTPRPKNRDTSPANTPEKGPAVPETVT